MIEYIKEDWLYRLPYRLDTMSYKGVNRPAYTILCLIYYSIKSILLLYFYFAYRFFKFIFWDGWRWIKNKDWEDSEDDNEQECNDEEIEYEDDEEQADEDDIIEEELPFCQLFTIGKEMCLVVDHIEMCPDETAFIRVVDDEGYTPLYKRKVRRDKLDNRFIVFNGENMYLDDKKTQPRITKKG